MLECANGFVVGERFCVSAGGRTTQSVKAGGGDGVWSLTCVLCFAWVGLVFDAARELW